MVIALALLITAFSAAAAQAETITVTNTGDGVGKCPSATECTLRAAVESAKAGDTISLPAGTYTLAGKPLEVEKDLAITGAGAGSTTLTSSPASELIYLYEAELNVSGITFKGSIAHAKTEEIEEGGKRILAEGYAPGEGGAIYSDYGILRVNGCTFTEDAAQAEFYINAKNGAGGYGGAIYSYEGKTTIAGSTFTNDTADGAASGTESDRGGEGGAIYNDYGSLSISSSSFSANNANGAADATAKYNDGGIGAAVYSEYGATRITTSTFTGNHAHGGATGKSGTEAGYEGYGGGLYLEEANATISNSTFTGNEAGSGTDAGSKDGEGGYGAGIYNDEGSLTLVGSVVKENTAASTHNGGEGGGVYSYGSTTIEQSTIASNKAPNGYGGGLVNDGGHMSVLQSTVTSNESADAAGIYSDGSTSVWLSTISGNNAPGGDGGGIYSDEPELELMQSNVTSNTAEYGGGIYNDEPMTASNSTIAKNTATEDGGGIYNDAPMTASNSTIAENTAKEQGGGVYNEAVGALANVTLYGNAAGVAGGGGNLYLDDYELSLHDTLIAAGIAPTSGGNCAFNGTSGSVVSKGYNAEDSNQCTFNLLLGDQVDAALNLGPLQNNGGPTETLALLTGSAAIDKGDPAGCTNTEGELLTTDQRGVARPQNGRCDVGAFEYVPPTPPAPAPKPVAPRDSGLAVSPGSFAPTSDSASIARRHKGKKGSKAPKGASISYNDSEAATTTFTIVELKHGYRPGKGLCKATSKHGKKPKHAKKCTKEVTLKGSFSHVDAAGHNHFEFTGHIGGRKLSKGSYVLIAKPRLGTLSGPSISAVFKIV